MEVVERNDIGGVMFSWPGDCVVVAAMLEATEAREKVSALMSELRAEASIGKDDLSDIVSIFCGTTL